MVSVNSSSDQRGSRPKCSMHRPKFYQVAEIAPLTTQKYTTSTNQSAYKVRIQRLVL